MFHCKFDIVASQVASTPLVSGSIPNLHPDGCRVPNQYSIIVLLIR